MPPGIIAVSRIQACVASMPFRDALLTRLPSPAYPLAGNRRTGQGVYRKPCQHGFRPGTAGRRSPSFASPFERHLQVLHRDDALPILHPRQDQPGQGNSGARAALGEGNFLAVRIRRSLLFFTPVQEKNQLQAFAMGYFGTKIIFSYLHGCLSILENIHERIELRARPILRATT